MSENHSAQGFEFSSVKLIGFIVKWWKPIFIVTFAAAVLAAVGSLFIKNKYKSTVVMFPSTTHSISKALIDVQGASKADLLEFGMEEDADQMVQILNSDEIYRKIVEKFDLMNHYDINPEGKLAQTKLRKEYEGNISFKRTEYLSVRVDVMDTDPNMAAAIANEIAAQLDTVKNRMQKERAIEGLYIVQQEFDEQSAFIKSMEDSLKVIRRKGINDYESQAEVLNKEYATALAKGDQRAIKALEEKLEILSEYGGEYVALKEGLELYREQLSLLKVKLKEARLDATQPISHKFVVNHAFPAEKKTYPRRSLIVIGTALGAFLLSLFVIIGIENWRTYKASLSEQK
ncbi:MAG: hypothetical protein MH137_05580 [Flavobacteriales bacterium]|nr:hypothetical protein [Flavobacteriales bacterium]